MKPYSELENWQIEQEVLTRLGYCVGRRNNFHEILTPDGQHICWIARRNLKEAWITIFHVPIIPHHSRDLNYALKLPLADGYLMYLSRNSHDVHIARIIEAEEGATAITVEGANPARALCEAWLLYMDAAAKHPVGGV